MFQFINNWFERRIIRRSTITAEQWHDAFASLPLLQGLSADEKDRLQELAILFLHHKIFEGAQGLNVTQPMKMVIALQACLPLLNTGLRGYQGWYTVVIYPAGFAPKRVVRDEFGVEHHVQSNLAGEAWLRGPVVLSWGETAHAGVIDGHNLVIHEFAHKLDMINGDANGFPPLHVGMDSGKWAEAFTAGFEDLQHKCNRGKHIGIDCYAASSPAEYFAVLSEVFFERPSVLYKHSADVYELLRQYYRQDPLTRLP
ncbi:MAG: zinc-dependent peptidase [Gammaproteobacteria bacterium]|nr:zinc-dependent peptidase [Gammaproteobacteria bacterium]MCW8924347.1 zinc-dependent peptidase [Gammaproteobacteria bacterium]